MRLYVFLLVCLFRTGVISLAVTPPGTVLVLLVAAPVAVMLSWLPLSATLFGFLFVALFAAPALFHAASGVVRAMRGEAEAWSAWSWAVSFAAIPITLYRALTSLSGWH